MSVKKIQGPAGVRHQSDLRNEFGIRERRNFVLKAEAIVYDDARRQAIRQQRALRKGEAVIVDPNITLAEWSVKWLEKRAVQMDGSTVARQKMDLDNHILPTLGSLRVREISRHRGELFLLEILRLKKEDGKPYSRGTVSNIFHTLSSMLTDARSAHLITEHPLRGLWGEFNKGKKKRGTRAKVKAFDAASANLLRQAALKYAPRYYPYFATLLLAGLRPSEGFGVRAEKIDFVNRRLYIDVQLNRYGGEKTTKTGKERYVDIAAGLLPILRSLVVERQAAELAGEKVGPYLFFPEVGEENLTSFRVDVQNLGARCRKALRRVLRKAGLAAHHNLHSLRHTYATLLLSAGYPPKYVRDQLGHESFEETISTYGSWFPAEAPGAVDALSARLGFATSGNLGHELDTIAGVSGVEKV